MTTSSDQESISQRVNEIIIEILWLTYHRHFQICIFLNKNFRNSNKILLKYVP